MRVVTAAIFTAALVTPALADINVRFIEGAPKDTFEIVNANACVLSDASVTIDLAGSSAGLIFDVTGSGAGVQVFQPFEVVTGVDALSAIPTVRDGEKSVTLNIKSLPANAKIAFTIDVDDTIGQREITVSNSEIAGATIQLSVNGQMASGTFDETSTARVEYQACVS